MLQDSKAFSGFSVNDISEALKFYGQVLGLDVRQTPMGMELLLRNGDSKTFVFVYEKPDHRPAEFTILNFNVPDIDAAVEALRQQNVAMEIYDNLPAPQDESGILRNDDPTRGPSGIAWFKDPAGNVLSVIQD